MRNQAGLCLIPGFCFSGEFLLFVFEAVGFVPQPGERKAAQMNLLEFFLVSCVLLQKTMSQNLRSTFLGYILPYLRPLVDFKKVCVLNQCTGLCHLSVRGKACKYLAGYLHNIDFRCFRSY